MQDAQEAQPIAGVFTPRIVARLHREGFDGSVRFSTEGSTRVVYFRRGEIASAASNAEADRLPNILIGDGRLTGPQLEMARSRLQPGTSLGKTLIDLGFLTPSELLQGARRQVRQILAACFALTEGAYQICPGPLPREITVLGLPTRRLIFDALIEAGDRQAVVREMGSMESVYHPSAAFQEGLASLKLDAATEQVGRTVDGRRTLRDISSQTALDDFTVSKVVLALEILGLAESDQTVPPAGATQWRRIPVESAESGEEVSIPASRMAEPEIGPVTPGTGEAPAVQGPSASPDLPEEDADLPPPIPPGELPAFAAPSVEIPEWRVDPATGEKSLPGPVEMTFDGPVAPPADKPIAARRWGSIAAIAAVILTAAFVASFLRSRQPDGAESVPTAVERAEESADAVAEAAAVPDEAPPPTSAEPGEPGAAEPTTALVQQAPVPPPAPAEEGSAGPPAESSPAVAEPTLPAGSLPAGSERIAAAHQLIEEGRVAEAAAAFRELVREDEKERFTVQVMIACEPATVQKALAATRPRGDLIVLPFALQGRACYRTCWGVYDSKEQAQDAASSLPVYLAEATRKPVVLSFARLAPPS